MWIVALASLVLVTVSPAQVRGPIKPGRRRPPRPPVSRAVEAVWLSGTLVKVRGSYFVLETDERGEVRVLVTSGTRFLLEDRVISVETIRAGDSVRVQASEQGPEVFKALQVALDIASLTNPIPRLPRGRAAPRSPPDPFGDADEGPPKLLRRKPGEPRESGSRGGIRARRPRGRRQALSSIRSSNGLASGRSTTPTSFPTSSVEK